MLSRQPSGPVNTAFPGARGEMAAEVPGWCRCRRRSWRRWCMSNVQVLRPLMTRSRIKQWEAQKHSTHA